jgi:hypothetical protein
LLTVEINALAALRLADGYDAAFDLGLPLVKFLLGVLLSEIWACKELGLEPRSVQASVFIAHIIGKPLTRDEIAVAVSTQTDHANNAPVYSLVYSVGF